MPAGAEAATRKGLKIKGVWGRLTERACAAWPEALACAAAVALSWLLALILAGHARPMFAVVAAVVCLAPGLPNHGRQAVGMLSGVLTGILIGEASLMLHLGPGYVEAVFRLSAVTFLAIVVAALWGQGPVAGIQSGVSAVMVLTMGPVMAGPERLIDVLIGTTVGLVFSQIVLTPDPVKNLEASCRTFLGELSQGVLIAERAVREGDANRGRIAAQQLGAARGRLVALDGGVSLARDNARWTLRGLMAGPEVAELADRYDRHAARVFAQGLILGDELYHALRDVPQLMPAEVAPLLHHVAMNLSDPARAVPIDRDRMMRVASALPPEAEHWRAVIVQASALSAGGGALYALPEETNHPAA